MRKRLRKLVGGGYLVTVQEDRMSRALFTVGPVGKRQLELSSQNSIVLERRPPVQREHFLAINDLRIAAELAGGLKYFYGAWELPGLGWKYPIIPDGIAAFPSKTFAVEFDRGLEGLQFFIRTKMAIYSRGFEGFPLSGVLIVADRLPRMTALAREIGDRYGAVFFSTLSLVRRHDLLAPIFFRNADEAGSSLL